MIKQNDMQQITKAKGRPMLTWVGKHPLERVEWYPAQEKEVYGVKNSTEFNKLFWGDNLQVLSHLLKDHRGEIDLIYIDPPFDSKADYVKKVKIRGQKVEGQQQSILEEKQYADIWENDEYLQFMYERLIIMRELLSDKGTFYLHCDWHKSGHLRLLMDELFEDYDFAEIIWVCGLMGSGSFYPKSHESILCYKSKNAFYNPPPRLGYSSRITKALQKDDKGWFYTRGRETSGGMNNLKTYISNNPTLTKEQAIEEANDVKGQTAWDVWMGKDELATAFNDFPTGTYAYIESESSDYPTQKPRELLERIIKASSREGDMVADFFLGSGTTAVVAQQLGRKWIGCDINLGAIQTSTKRLAQIIEDQEKANKIATLPSVARNDGEEDFKGLMAFKIYNVNDYDIFKNEIEAKEIVMEMYGVEPIKRSQFDGVLDNKFVKIMPLNKVLNKLDIKRALKNVEDSIDSFTPKTTSKGSEEIYEEGVIIICSGAELDSDDFLKKENKTGVKVVIRDILNDKKSLIFKKKPEARIEVKANDKKLSVVIKEFYSPILMRKLELENEKVIDKKTQAKVEDFKQIIDSVAIDVDYNGKLFNAEIIDLPDKKELIKAEYSHTYKKEGKNTVAIKIVDVLGEEYFETFEVIS